MLVPEAVQAFPTRPMLLRPPRGGSRLGSLLSAVFLLALAVAPVPWFGPGILRDLTMRADARPVIGGGISDGRCHIHSGVFALCDATLTARGKNGPLSDGMHYAFLQWPGASHTAVVMQSAAVPDHLTTDIGLDRLTNRMLTLGGWVLLLTGLVGALGLAGLREARRRRSIVQAARTGVTPMPVRLLKATRLRGTQTWKLGYDESGPRTVNWNVGKSDAPFLISPDGWMLALRGPAGVGPMPLDDRLSWAELTDVERQRILAARDAQWSNHPPAG